MDSGTILGPIEQYITNMDVNGIYEEFRNDNAFKTAVCNYVSLVAEDRKAARVTDVIRVAGTPFPFNLSDFVIDILIAAALKACGRDKQSNDLIKYAVVGSVLLIGLGIGYSIWNSKKSRRSRK